MLTISMKYSYPILDNALLRPWIYNFESNICNIVKKFSYFAMIVFNSFGLIVFNNLRNIFNKATGQYSLAFVYSSFYNLCNTIMINILKWLR